MKLIAEANTDVYTYSTFFYTKLVNSGLQAVSRWTKETDLFTKRLLLVPVHLGNHWCLASIDIARLQITYYDSLHGRNPACLETLKSYILEKSVNFTATAAVEWHCSTSQSRQTVQTAVCSCACLLGVCLATAILTSANLTWLPLEDRSYWNCSCKNYCNSVYIIITICILLSTLLNFYHCTISIHNYILLYNNNIIQ